MSKKTKKRTNKKEGAHVAPPISPEVLVDEGYHAPREEDPDEEDQREAVEHETATAEAVEAEEEAKPSNSIVAAKFKDRYIEHAKELGIKGKAARRSNWDWLAQVIAAECLDKQHKIEISKFVAILDANGVDHSKWDNRSRGWEGRLRMTGRVALQRIVADRQLLKLPDGSDIKPPQDFINKYKTKE